jgi:hypothetical protein
MGRLVKVPSLERPKGFRRASGHIGLVGFIKEPEEHLQRGELRHDGSRREVL